MRIEKAKGIGFCYGVRRAIEILEKVARERGSVATLGAPVHNRAVLQRLAAAGVTVAEDIDSLKGSTVAIGAHGVTRAVQAQVKAGFANVIDTTCPFVHRAQVAARRLSEAGFYVVIYGEADHPEVKGILGWTNGQGIATLDEGWLATVKPTPRRLGVLSQTTQMPAYFAGFVKKLIDAAFGKDSELRVIDTICHDIRARQAAASALASRVDLMLVVGGHGSANSNHLAQLCSTVTETHLVENAREIRPEWFGDSKRIGVTSGASTPEHAIEEVLKRLESLG
ncbi:MAG: 4-hydroxy-3-methylbut-2-enyl diphosphate reductase [Chloroflexi bacterium]|nr:4-hydroxy-3-methylbut-2-enyl diphosphate reductase [Chloroflexota bacterium]